MIKHLNTTTVAATLFTFVLGTLVMQTFIRPPSRQVPLNKELPKKECEGKPIYVDYPFQGGFIDPWACKVQCEDQIQRFIIYDNGLATQCEILPGCNDWGEDNGITCELPEMISEEE